MEIRVWYFVYIAHLVIIASEANRILSRKRRYLVFPEGSSLHLRVSNVKRMPFNVTLPYQFLTEAEEKYPLPDHYIRKKGKRPPAGKDKKKQSPKKPSVGNNTSGWVMGSKSKGKQGEKKQKWQHDQWRVTPVEITQWGRPEAGWVNQYGPAKDTPTFEWSNYGTYFHPEQYFRHGYYSGKEPFYHHRRDRRDIYERVETLLDARGLDGRACILRALCEAAENSLLRGSFVHDVLRLIFTLPEGSEPDLSRYQKHTEDCHQWSYRCPYSLLHPDLVQDD